MRVYLPCTLPGLARAVTVGELGPGPLSGFAVTPALVEWYVSGDTEELEYVALMEAARASLRMLAADLADGFDAPARRVVVAAEVPDSAVLVSPDLNDRGRVRVQESVPLGKLAAVHVDDVDAQEDVAAAVSALSSADDGDDDAQFIVDSADAHELLWYATQEIPDILP
ncbi:hypothetical protein Aph01nite_04210 [Acrocarpospora phusangensis]|uniref:Uncharacterized protein n=1 Tax=Acrocarpospora phusangensis TaxID=1070424 RepID=A0A919UHZ6_9ACTN|nr:hypothetical protein [Acrocarpospora phusangensis]GIH22111.1 hypothetical protein Aph01nite_04210 [Acrocarpospora phusangensis]